MGIACFMVSLASFLKGIAQKKWACLFLDRAVAQIKTRMAQIGKSMALLQKKHCSFLRTHGIFLKRHVIFYNERVKY
jgi:hypothetical protein